MIEYLLNVAGQFENFIDWCVQILNYIWDWIDSVIVALIQIFEAIGAWIWTALKTLLSLDFTTIWNAIKRGFSRLCRLSTGYKNTS